MEYYEKSDVSTEEEIVLVKCSVDLSKYNVKETKTKIILTPKKKEEIIIKKITKLKSFDFTNSEIINCSLNKKKNKKDNYKALLIDVYHLIKNGKQIIKNTVLNIETVERNDCGFHFLQKLGLSFQGCDSNRTITEIFNQCIKNDITIELEIKMDGGQTILFKFET
jgi:hypothetical protein